MAGKKRPVGVPEKAPADILAEALKNALSKRDDFVITFETDDEGNCALHVMTGKLITPCMLGTLSNRCELQEDEGSRHTILRKARPKKAKKTSRSRSKD